MKDKLNPPFITEGLYKVSDKISRKKEDSASETDTPAETSAISGENTAVQAEIPAEKVLEFERLRHDLESRLAALESAYAAEKQLLSERCNALSKAEEKLQEVCRTMEETNLPDAKDPELRKQLRTVFRSLELMRLEIIRISCAMDGSRPAGDLPSGRAQTSPAAGQSEDPVTPGTLFKKGFFLYLPLGILFFICTLLLAVSFILAWKVAF